MVYSVCHHNIRCVRYQGICYDIINTVLKSYVISFGLLNILTYQVKILHNLCSPLCCECRYLLNHLCFDWLLSIVINTVVVNMQLTVDFYNVVLVFEIHSELIKQECLFVKKHVCFKRFISQYRVYLAITQRLVKNVFVY